MRNVLIIGHGAYEMATAVAVLSKAMNVAVIAFDDFEQQRRKLQFEPEPINFISNKRSFKETVFYEKTPSKYINKPKNNFKRK